MSRPIVDSFLAAEIESFLAAERGGPDTARQWIRDHPPWVATTCLWCGCLGAAREYPPGIRQQCEECHAVGTLRLDEDGVSLVIVDEGEDEAKWLDGLAWVA